MKGPRLSSAVLTQLCMFIIIIIMPVHVEFAASTISCNAQKVSDVCSSCCFIHSSLAHMYLRKTSLI